MRNWLAAASVLLALAARAEGNAKSEMRAALNERADLPPERPRLPTRETDAVRVERRRRHEPVERKRAPEEKRRKHEREQLREREKERRRVK